MVIVNDPNARDLLLEQETNIHVKAVNAPSFVVTCQLAQQHWIGFTNFSHKAAIDTDSAPNH
jgi:hypothetical protein